MICEVTIDEHLANIVKRNMYSLDSQPHRNIFVVGAPRSGTTLLMQLLCYTMDLGYIDNLVARFHWNPVVGLALRKELEYKKRFSGRSLLGRTSEISEPHEFGKFWLNRLGYEDMRQVPHHAPDLCGLDFELSEMSRIEHNDMVYKVFNMIFHIRRFNEISKSDNKWIHIERELLPNCISIAEMRKKSNKFDTPMSLMPSLSIRESNPINQIISQVKSINSMIEDSFDTLDGDSYMKITYRDLCTDTADTLRKVAKFLGHELNSLNLDYDTSSVRYVDYELAKSKMFKDFSAAIDDV